MGIAEAIILAIVEGFTEFLPVSSTGHMIIASSLLGIQHDEFTKLFEVSIQFGAILAVVVLYGKKFFQFRNWQFYAKLIVGVIPALLLGFLFSDQIDKMLESPTVVAISLLIGGVVLMFIDKMFQKPKLESDDQISYGKAFTVGLFQTIAMIPGVSRSAASIIGGMSQRFTRNLAAEFSFFLAVPTMFAASFYTLFVKKWTTSEGVVVKGYKLVTDTQEHTIAFLTGNLVAFLVALLAIRFFINYLKIYGFKVFGVYRILAGITLLILLFTKVIE
ncbi:MAG: Undecaprenyl-diphosphatase [Bacteroidetes bacterium ADurb.BinA245]|jgi:undecaprenyl-diphosphatase|nr:undecaprenyl-diphosphate phosphatase [Chitinophagaceae bacterium]OPZ16738.1 MAG: Undecaprenyl-diphosphatase [Bacteroidetes bacterium ADurb.BinA245]HNA19480.1 undecaprenyl-diphosphate phosphatase [Chitinophagaceae bacterium]HNF37913.1 undecaprenyl-diphosphate phosphatase [Chitinophagaceae bacterium]HNO00976.1 undecaprenyl-diphosphate phosphatase [Chitinophagaceae bacterium]